MRRVEIEGPVLLLLGPIGEFFSRFAKFLLREGVETHKIAFAYKEFFIPKSIIHHFNQPLSEYRKFIRQFLEHYQIKQIYMSGDFSIIHTVAIEEARALGIDAYVFELGYVRPNYITLEKERVNARSNLNKPVEFYQALPESGPFVEPVLARPRPWLWRKAILPFCFIQQAFTDFDIIPGVHKSNPKPIFLYYQCLGSLRKPLYFWQERGLIRKIYALKKHFLVPLQVDSDSQITLSSKYSGMQPFIEEVITSFAAYATRDASLVFKHHPADRGYNNYASLISELGRLHNVENRVFYIHDASLPKLFNNCQGVVTVNSTVGLDALKHQLPLKVMGETFYDLPGLSSQQSLDDFWTDNYCFDEVLWQKFYRYMIEQTQLPGCFHRRLDFKQLFITKPVGEFTCLSQ